MTHDGKSVVPTVLGKAERRDLARTDNSNGVLSDQDKELILRGLMGGAGITTILKDLPGCPGIGAVVRARNNDAEFAEAYDIARAAGLEVGIDEALDYSYAVRSDTKMSIAAQKQLIGVLAASEKLAPKRYGPLLKLAGHDGGALQIGVISFKDAPLIDATATVVESTKVD